MREREGGGEEGKGGRVRERKGGEGEGRRIYYLTEKGLGIDTIFLGNSPDLSPQLEKTETCRYKRRHLRSH